MTRIVGETRIRPKNEITVPSKVREMLNLNPGDLIRFEYKDGVFTVCKAITRKINHNGNGGEN